MKKVETIVKGLSFSEGRVIVGS